MRSSNQVKLHFRFNLFQKRFDNLFINIIIWFYHKKITTNRLTSSNVIPFKTIEESKI